MSKYEKENESVLEGRNAVMEAIKSGRSIEKLIVCNANLEGSVKKIIAMAAQKGIVIKEVSRAAMDRMSATKNHQGVMAEVAAHSYAELEDILQNAKDKNEPPFIIILDGVTDPHNLGAIIRTAETAGAHGVIIPKRRAVGLTATVGKASAGALEYMPVARVANLSATVEELKKQNVWIACADMGGEDYFDNDALKGAVAIIIGAEGAGVSRLLKEKSDFTLSIPMYGKISSLNASVSAALIMYEAVRQRNYK